MTCATAMLGDTWRWMSGLSADDHVAFVDRGQQDVREVDGPGTIAGLVRADEVLAKGPGQEQRLVLAADGARFPHLLDHEVAGMHRWCQPFEIRPG